MSTPHNEPPAPEKRSAPKRIAKIGCLGLIGLFVLLLIIGLIGAAMSGTLGNNPPQETTAASATPSPSETTAVPSPSPSTSTTEPPATPSPTATTPAGTPSREAPKPTTAEPTRETPKTDAPKDPLAAVTAPVDGAKAHMEGPVLFVQIPLQEGFSGPSKSLAQKDAVDVLKAVQQSGVDYSRVFIQGDPAKGGLGMLNAGYDKATVDNIDFSTVVVPEIWNARDAGSVSPKLQ